MQAWYLVYSKPRQEHVALENLLRQGYSGYLPLLRERRRRQGRLRTVDGPMFPRYLFVRLSDETDDWGPIRSTIGVVSLVRFGGRAARVPDDLIAVLYAAENGQGVYEPPVPALRPGDAVRIVDGVMAGYEAIFQARSGHERVLLLLEIAGKSARIEVDADHVEPASRRWLRRPRPGR